MKIDCSIFKNYIKERLRLCDTIEHGDCSRCPLNSFDDCINLHLHEVDAAVIALQNWSDSHPVKIRLDVFREQYPLFTKDSDNLPCVKPCDLDYTLRLRCSKQCADCAESYWNELVEGEDDR